MDALFTNKEEKVSCYVCFGGELKPFMACPLPERNVVGSFQITDTDLSFLKNQFSGEFARLEDERRSFRVEIQALEVAYIYRNRVK